VSAHGERDLLLVVRYGLPVAIVVAGILVMVVGSSPSAVHGGLGIVGAGLAVGLLNVFYRMSVSGDRSRDDEDAARDYFDEHGHWPDEGEPPVASSLDEAPPDRVAS
jgi:hypothetical protein